MKYKKSEREIYHTSQCASCILEVAQNYYTLTKKCLEKQYPQSNEQNVKKQNQNQENIQDFQKILQKLAQKFKPQRSPNEIANDLFLYAVKVADPKGKCEDPWREMRDESNQVALEVIPFAKKMLKTIKNPKERLFCAIQWSIVGNNIDYGTSGHEVNLGKDILMDQYEKVKTNGFQINHFDQLWEELQREKKCMYLLDNAGEIAFDRLVIKELVKNEIKTVAVVKGAPISNDAIMRDARKIRLTEICEVITTGSADLGFHPEHNSKDFLEKLNRQKIVIAKGQANWEATYAYQDILSADLRFYNLLKIKCDVHGRLLGYPKGSNFIMMTTRKSFKD